MYFHYTIRKQNCLTFIQQGAFLKAKLKITSNEF
jgi:hypothetical protein